MIFRLVIYFVFIFSFSLAQNNPNCDVNKVSAFDSLSNPSVRQTSTFLKQLALPCSSNAEFSEYSNEVLFDLMKTCPKTFLQALNTVQDEELTEIFIAIENPVHDNIQLELIKKKISAVKIKSRYRDRVISSLNTAISKASRQ